MVDFLGKIAEHLSQSPKPPFTDRLAAWWQATRRRKRQNNKSQRPGSLQSMEFQRRRYPAITRDEVCEKISRFRHVLGDDGGPYIDQISQTLFKISG